MRRLIYAVKASYYRTQAYLASQRGDGIAAVNFQQLAYEADRQLDVESIQA
jgi:hypothetical protein